MDEIEDQPLVAWQVPCPLRCGAIMKSLITRYNTRRYGVRMAVMQHLRNRHQMSGRPASIKADEAIRDLPRN